MTWDAGMVAYASLGDLVWVDVNGDGIQNGEAGLAGVTVYLYREGETSAMASTTTNISGMYAFTNLLPGDYFVEFALPGGYAFTSQDQGSDDALDSDADRSTGRTVSISLASGEHDLTWDAGVYEPASIGDFVWMDTDADGIQDTGETGQSGVTVYLYKPGTDGEPGGGDDTLISTTTTSATGYYAFSNLIPGDYFVEFVLPTGTIFSPQNQGTNDAVDSDAYPPTGQTEVTALSSAENDTSWDAGLINTLAAIGDKVWHDLDGDGVQDVGEPGIANVRVVLSGPSGGTTFTNSDGDYYFGNLTPGSYNLDFTLHPFYDMFTLQDQGTDDTVDSDANTSTGQTASTSLTAGEFDPTWDAGMYRLASIGDRVWEDANADGIQDVGETGIENVTVSLYDGNDQLLASTTTNVYGGYSFTDLTPGDYYLVFSPPVGYSFSPQDRGGDENVDSDANTSTGRTPTTLLTSGENDMTWDAGMVQPASIGDRVWFDTDSDGIQDGGESGATGVTVYLYSPGADGEPGGGDDSLVDTTATDGTGFYSFTDLEPGAYYVEFVLPSGYVFSPQDQGSDDAVDSDPSPSTGQTAVTTLVSVENDTSWDAGLLTGVASLGDTVWNDLDYDGIQDPGEGGLANVIVKLFTSGGTPVYTTTTNALGNYAFTNLAPGAYYVQFVLPDGYLFSPANQGADDSLDSDADVSTGQTGTITLSAGDNDITWDAGLYRPASISNYVWEDTDQDGIQDESESGIAGVTVELYDENNDLVASTTTNVNGGYIFAGLVPDDYYVKFVTEIPYAFSPQDQGTDEAKDSDADPSNGEAALTALDPGENDPNWDAGMARMDFGDLWDSPYATLHVSNGARHVVRLNGLRLGSEIDAESNGQPSADAAGDDNNGDDEDGVWHQAGLAGSSNNGGWTNGTVASGNGGSLLLLISNGSGVPQVFVDFDGDETLEEVVLRDGSGNPISMPMYAGYHRIYFDIPDGTFGGSQKVLPTRVRLSSHGGLGATGTAPDGEVEDYVWNFSPTAVTLESLLVSGGDKVNLIQVLLIVLVLGLTMVVALWPARSSRKSHQT